jgi:hypothetical protein
VACFTWRKKLRRVREQKGGDDGDSGSLKAVAVGKGKGAGPVLRPHGG